MNIFKKNLNSNFHELYKVFLSIQIEKKWHVFRWCIINHSHHNDAVACINIYDSSNSQMNGIELNSVAPMWQVVRFCCSSVVCTQEALAVRTSLAFLTCLLSRGDFIFSHFPALDICCAMAGAWIHLTERHSRAVVALCLGVQNQLGAL